MTISEPVPPPLIAVFPMSANRALGLSCGLRATPPPQAFDPAPRGAVYRLCGNGSPPLGFAGRWCCPAQPVPVPRAKAFQSVRQTPQAAILSGVGRAAISRTTCPASPVGGRGLSVRPWVGCQGSGGSAAVRGCLPRFPAATGASRVAVRYAYNVAVSSAYVNTF